MSEEKPTARTATVAAILLMHEKYGKQFNFTLPDALRKSRRASTMRTLVFGALAIWGLKQAYNNASTEPPAYGPAAGFTVLAYASYRLAKGSLRSRMVTDYYYKMSQTEGAAKTEQAMRTFAEPSLKQYKKMGM